MSTLTFLALSLSSWKIVNRKDKLLLAFSMNDEGIVWPIREHHVCNFLRVIIVSLGNYSFWLFYSLGYKKFHRQRRRDTKIVINFCLLYSCHYVLVKERRRWVRYNFLGVLNHLNSRQRSIARGDFNITRI